MPAGHQYMAGPDSGSDHPNVDGVQAFLAFLDFKFHGIVFPDGSLDFRFVDKDLFIGVVGLDKAEASEGIVKFNGTCFHDDLFYCPFILYDCAGGRKKGLSCIPDFFPDVFAEGNEFRKNLRKAGSFLHFDEKGLDDAGQ